MALNSNVVSIPQGTIKRYIRQAEYDIYPVSIPQGTIKRRLDIDAPRSYSFVSIPQGTIKSRMKKENAYLKHSFNSTRYD